MVHSGGRWANRLASIEILSGDAGHVWRGGKVNDRLCARSRGYREKLGEPGDNREETAAFVAKARSDKARMEAIAVTSVPRNRRASPRVNKMLQSFERL